MAVAFVLATVGVPVYAQNTQAAKAAPSVKAGSAAKAVPGAVPATKAVPAVEVDETSLLLDAVDPAAATGTGKAGASSVWAVVRTVLALLVVAAAIYGAIFLLKKFARPPEARNPYLKVLASQHLGSNRFVHVVSLGQKAWLVGAAEGGVDLIAEIDDKETIDAMQLEDSRAAGTAAWALDFNSFMRKLGVRDRSGSGGVLSSAEGIRKGRERLRGL